MFLEFSDVLTIEDMQNALGVGRSTAYRLIKSGKVKHLRIGKHIKIPKRYLIDYIIAECYNNGIATSKPPVQLKEAMI